MPFGHEAVGEVELDVVTSDDEIVEVVGRRIDEGFSGIVPVPIDVEAGFIEGGGEDIDDRDRELEDIKEER